jgi:hypothetical protein
MLAPCQREVRGEGAQEEGSDKGLPKCLECRPGLEGGLSCNGGRDGTANREKCTVCVCVCVLACVCVYGARFPENHKKVHILQETDEDSTTAHTMCSANYIKN